MAAAIGQSLNIPILIRALACDIYRLGPALEAWNFSREFLLALDAGIDPEDPTAPVDHYHLPWWTGQSRPDADEILSTHTLARCLAHHKMVSDRVRDTRPVEAEQRGPPLNWQRDLSLSPEGLNVKCGQCRLYRAVGVTAMDRLQDYRHHLHGLKTAQDARVDLTSRRAAGFFQLHEAALLKEDSVNVEERASSEESPDSAWSLLRLRTKSKGKHKIAMNNVAARVEQDARAELARLTNRPDVKWTWGVDLDQPDVLRLFQREGQSTIRSGYRMSLRQGRLGPGSSNSSWRDPGPPLDYDPPDVPFLEEDDWPVHFTIPPIRHWAAGPPAINCGAPASILTPATSPTGKPSQSWNRLQPTLDSEMDKLGLAVGQPSGSRSRLHRERDDFHDLVNDSVRDLMLMCGSKFLITLSRFAPNMLRVRP
jgi:hypothetical protein